MKKLEKKQKSCFECEECECIGEGDFLCTKEEPRMVLIDYNCPTEDFTWCVRKNSKK